MRVRAFGLPDVVRRLFRLSESAPSELNDTIQAIVEARAIRPWELFDEGIISFQLLRTQPAVVAEFSLIGLTGFNNPGQWLVVVEEIRAIIANQDVRLSAVPVVFNAGVVVRPRLLDARFGSATVDAPPIFSSGSNAALPGTQVDIVVPAVSPTRVMRYVIPVGLPYPGGTNILVVSSQAVNTLIATVFRGFAIPWRDR